MKIKGGVNMAIIDTALITTKLVTRKYRTDV